MPEIPECLNRRYLALDELIEELSKVVNQGSEHTSFDEMSTDPGIKLMCDFWNILKENPECDLSQAVKQRMGVRTPNSLYHQDLSCFLADNNNKSCKTSKSKDAEIEDMNKIKNPGCSSQFISQSQQHMKAKSRHDMMSLSKVLNNLKEAASLDKKCNSRIMELMETQKELQDHIQYLEQRENDGIRLLKEADSMWSSMEESYKKKIAESLERQNELMLELKEIENSKSKWRKNKKDLESKLSGITKQHQEVAEKIAQKQNDIKCMNMDIENFKQKIENNNLLIAGSKKDMNNKTEASNKKIASIADEVTKLQTTLEEVQKQKRNKEQEGQKYVKDARNDLQKMCRVLLQKKLENENLMAETESLNQEINFLKQASDQSQDKFNAKQNILNEEIKKINNYIEEYQAKCTRFNRSIDTEDVGKLCNDCPKCKQENESKSESENHYDKKSVTSCVCTNVKEKFLSNVFENMYTVLEKQSRTDSGKAVADAVIKSLKNSRNGKVDAKTKQIIKKFMLDTVKNNNNLTIVGGAVKTRCEMDADTYQQLMLCLKQDKEDKPLKSDKGTVAKKACCIRWGGVSECNCPGGANSCICAKTAPPPVSSKDEDAPVRDGDDALNPTEQLIGMVLGHPDSQPTSGKQVNSDNRETVNSVPSAVGTEVATRTPDSAVKSADRITKVRAAQCLLGTDTINSSLKVTLPTSGRLKMTSEIPESMYCRCENTPTKRCRCIREEDKIKCEISTSPIHENDSVIVINDHDYFMEKEINSPKKVSKKLDHKATMLSTIPSGKVDFRKSSKATVLSKPIRDIKNRRISFQTTEEKRNSSESGVSLENTQSSIPATILDTPSDIFDMMDLIEEKPTADCNSKASWNKNSFKHLNDEFFVNIPNYSDERPIIKKNSSYTRLFEIKTDFDEILSRHNNSSHDMNNEFKVSDYMKSPLVSISQQLVAQDKFEIVHKNNRLEPTENIIQKFELEKKYETNSKVSVKIEKPNGVYKVIAAPVTKTLSGNMAINIEDYSDEVEMTSKEHVVILKRSVSGAIILDENLDGVPNAVIRKTASGSLLIVITNPVFRSMKPTKAALVPKEKFYKVKIKTANNYLAEPPALLKQTQSFNYVFVPDKEYENRYKQTIQDLLEDSTTEYYVNMRRTVSDNFVLYFDDIDSEIEPNALIVKNESGDIKVITTKKTSVSTAIELKKTTLGTTSKVLDELIYKLPKTIKQSNKSFLASSLSTIKKKSSSDTNTYEKLKPLYSDNKDVLEVSSAILKMTSTGQHAVVLDKESKKTFIKNLKRFLQNDSDSQIPVQKSNNGEIIIDLNSEHNKNHYGSLKITPSGNLYVVVNKESVKDISKDFTKSTDKGKRKYVYATNTVSWHSLHMPIESVNKAVTTTCNSMPDEVCDGSTCACSTTPIKIVDKMGHTRSENNMIFYRNNSDDDADTFSSQNIRRKVKSVEEELPQQTRLNHSHDVKFSDSNSTLGIISFLPIQLPSFLKRNVYP